MIANLNRLIESISDDIQKSLNTDCVTTEVTNADAAMRVLAENHCFENTEITDGEPVVVPAIEINLDMMICSVSIPVDGGKIVMYNSTADCNTQQVSIDYACDDTDATVPIVLTEVKRGELAEVHHMDANNRDIDIYVYADPRCEDYTDKRTIAYKDITDIES